MEVAISISLSTSRPLVKNIRFFIINLEILTYVREISEDFCKAQKRSDGLCDAHLK